MDAARHLPELIQCALQPVGNLRQLILQVTEVRWNDRLRGSQCEPE